MGLKSYKVNILCYVNDQFIHHWYVILSTKFLGMEFFMIYLDNKLTFILPTNIKL